MGWYYNYGEATPANIKTLMDACLNEEPRLKVLESAVLPALDSRYVGIYYAALACDASVYGFVAPLMIEHGQWGYKPLDEDAGPVYDECPPAILDLLTPTDNEFALRWRAACREYH